MVHRPPTGRAQDAFDDADFPAYATGRAADMLGVTPEFLRSLDATGCLRPSARPAGSGGIHGTSCS